MSYRNSRWCGRPGSAARTPPRLAADSDPPDGSPKALTGGNGGLFGTAVMILFSPALAEQVSQWDLPVSVGRQTQPAHQPLRRHPVLAVHPAQGHHPAKAGLLRAYGRTAG